MPKTRESASPKAKKAVVSNGYHPTHEQVALRAYHIYLERGATPGNELEDWTRAERELMGEQNDKKGRKTASKPLKSIGAAA
jgi:Protein of unknown function (DUF2934)